MHTYLESYRLIIIGTHHVFASVASTKRDSLMSCSLIHVHPSAVNLLRKLLWSSEELSRWKAWLQYWIFGSPAPSYMFCFKFQTCSLVKILPNPLRNSITSDCFDFSHQGNKLDAIFMTLAKFRIMPPLAPSHKSNSVLLLESNHWPWSCQFFINATIC